MKSKPKSEQEWAEFHQKNRELAERLRTANKSYYDLSDTDFKNSLVNLSQEQLIEMKESMRSTMNFYKKVLAEPYYVEHPEKKDSMRYTEALRIAQSINSKGKIVHSLINQNH